MFLNIYTQISNSPLDLGAGAFRVNCPSIIYWTLENCIINSVELSAILANGNPINRNPDIVDQSGLKRKLKKNVSLEDWLTQFGAESKNVCGNINGESLMGSIEWVIDLVDEWVCWKTDGWTDGWMDGGREGGIDRAMDRWIGERQDE